SSHRLFVYGFLLLGHDFSYTGKASRGEASTSAPALTRAKKDGIQMTQADSVHTTPPTNTSANQTQSSRRGFLIQAAGVAAGGAALGMALPLPAPAATPQRVPDPIYAAIEAHKAARAAVVPIIDAHQALEGELPKERRRSDVNVWEEKIVETDDPR